MTTANKSVRGFYRASGFHQPVRSHFRGQILWIHALERRHLRNGPVCAMWVPRVIEGDHVTDERALIPLLDGKFDVISHVTSSGIVPSAFIAAFFQE